MLQLINCTACPSDNRSCVVVFQSIFSAYIGGVAVLLTCAFTKLLPLAPDSTAELLDRGTSADELTALAGPPFRDTFSGIFSSLSGAPA